MLNLRIIQPGQRDVCVEIDGDQATLGRAAGCDVVINQPYISKRHAKVVAGIVVVDLGSSNGTFIGGMRLKEATRLAGGKFHLGEEEHDVQVFVEHKPDGAVTATRIESVRIELDQERRRNAELLAEVATLRSGASDGIADPEALPLVLDLQRERDDLRGRLERLKKELEQREVDASEGVQARLANEAMQAVQRRSEELERQVNALQASAATPEVQAAKATLARRVAELEGDRAELEETVRRLRNDLAESAAAASGPAPPASDLFFKLQAENQKLRKDLAQAHEAPAGGASGLFVELQAENRDLRARLEALGTSQAAAPVTGANPSDGELREVQRENHELRLSKDDLAAELERMRAKVEQAAHRAPATSPVGAGASGVALSILQRLASEDIEAGPTDPSLGVEEFLVRELFRFLRHAELLVTRMAGNFIQLLSQQTMIPDMTGNLRSLTTDVIADPGDLELRSDLLTYLEELRKWLIVSLAAQKRASERFAEDLKSDLSERCLTADDPISPIKRFAGQAEAELWRRTKEYLKRLTSDVVEDRLEKLGRACAEEILREQDLEPGRA